MKYLGFFFLKKSLQSVVYNGGQEDVMYEGLWLSFRWIHENFHIFICIYYIEVGKFTSSILNIVKYLCTYIGSKKQITKFYTNFVKVLPPVYSHTLINVLNV